MNTKKLNALVFAYILNAIDAEPYGVQFSEDQHEAKVNWLYETFKSEYCFPQNLQRYGNEENVMREWIMGLPSSFNINFENHAILEIAREWGTLAEDAPAYKEDKIINEWFQFIAHKFFILKSRLQGQGTLPAKVLQVN